MTPRECETLIVLGQEISHAISSVYRLLDQQETLSTRPPQNCSELVIHIAEARKAERVAVKAFEDHCKARGCKS